MVTESETGFVPPDENPAGYEYWPFYLKRASWLAIRDFMFGVCGRPLLILVVGVIAFVSRILLPLYLSSFAIGQQLAFLANILAGAIVFFLPAWLTLDVAISFRRRLATTLLILLSYTVVSVSRHSANTTPIPVWMEVYFGLAPFVLLAVNTIPYWLARWLADWQLVGLTEVIDLKRAPRQWNVPQFSLRSMFVTTAIVAVIMAALLALRGTAGEHFAQVAVMMLSGLFWMGPYCLVVVYAGLSLAPRRRRILSGVIAVVLMSAFAGSQFFFQTQFSSHLEFLWFLSVYPLQLMFAFALRWLGVRLITRHDREMQQIFALNDIAGGSCGVVGLESQSQPGDL